MSVLKLHVKVFRFETNKDYNPAYESYFLEYQEDQYLLDLLKQLKGVHLYFHTNSNGGIDPISNYRFQ